MNALTKPQLDLAHDLIGLCAKHGITLQTAGDKLFMNGMLVSKVTPDLVHVLNPDERLPGVIITMTGQYRP